jgi:folate-dependent phosphoribosylglycinamide formyltransferase PurN
MSTSTSTPSVVLLCQHDERIDRLGLAAWIAASMRLAGLIVIHDDRRKRWRSLRAEYRRGGWMGLADVAAFRLVYGLTRAPHDRRWVESAVRRLTTTYAADLTGVPRLDVTDPNSEDARRFLERCQPDLAIARCRHLLLPAVFTIPTHGTFVLHPGICPEYRNAHGCFWALARRDLRRVGMTLLRVDAGIDTGPIYLQATCRIDERHESHRVIQYRVVLENLDQIARTLVAIVNGACEPVSTAGRHSAAWGQPRLTAYISWKRAARRAMYGTPDIAPLA